MHYEYDVAIVGAGPAGATTAICLSNSNLKVALIDKAEFPRDKICGDALSPDVVNQLNMIPLNTGELFKHFEQKIWCNAVRFVSPNFSTADVSLNKTNIQGYISPRLDFDAFMFNQAAKASNVTTYLGSAVNKISDQSGSVLLELANKDSINAKMVIGCDGAHSIVAKQLAQQKVDRNHHCAGLRQYYENVSGFSDDNAIELHFYKDFLPGYFWMFPLPNNRANIGVGMLSSHVSKHNVNLKEKLQEIITTHPNVAHRFKDAKPLESIKGMGLPLGSKKISLSGNRYLLTGDAGSLINPLSGEGIANAIRSGRIAADHVLEAFKVNKFDAHFNKAYDKEVYRRMWSELQLNYWLQRTMRVPALCNFVIKRAIGNKSIQSLILSGFDAKNLRKSLSSSSFYKTLFFGD